MICHLCLKDPKGDCGGHTYMVPESPTDFLKGVTPHECDGACRKHNAGITMDEGKGGVTPSQEGSGPAQAPGLPDPTHDPICADCSEVLSVHTSPILKDGVVVGVACPTNSCRRFVE